MISIRVARSAYTGALIGAIAMLAALACTPRCSLAADRCDLELVRAQVEQALPEFLVANIHVDNGAVVVRLAARDRVSTCAVALRASGTKLFTSTMDARLDAAGAAAVSRSIGSWFERRELQSALDQCCAAVTDQAFGDPPARLRSAVDAELADADRGADLPPRRAIGAVVVLGSLIVSLAIVLWPAVRRQRAEPGGSWHIEHVVLLCVAAIAVAIATTIAWHLTPEGDEIATLGTRHAALSTLVSWEEGGEPFNPPGSATLFGLWLRLHGGFFWARMLSLALIPLTAAAAYWAGASLGGRATGVAFAALLTLSPAYLRLAAIARAYALIVLALCLLLAMLARGARTPSRGVGLGLATLFALWTSYLLWPLAVATPWFVGLARRDRLRISGALAFSAAALLPRIANGVGAAREKTGPFEILGPVDAFRHALAATGLSAPQADAAPGSVAVIGGSAIAGGLILLAILYLWRRSRRQLAVVVSAVLLVAVPVGALLSGGQGIRERHVITVHVMLAFLAAIGLGSLFAAASGKVRGLVWLLVSGLAVCAFVGDRAALDAAHGWNTDIGRLSAGADLIVIVPRDAQGMMYAMLFGDAPEGRETVRWLPVCQLGTERWCRRVGQQQTVSVDEVSDGVVSAAAGVRRSVWIFRKDAAVYPGGLPRALGACGELLRDPDWQLVECAPASLRRE
jgi:hypothetical protein